MGWGGWGGDGALNPLMDPYRARLLPTTMGRETYTSEGLCDYFVTVAATAWDSAPETPQRVRTRNPTTRWREPFPAASLALTTRR
jgi:hypothetical protein